MTHTDPYTMQLWLCDATGITNLATLNRLRRLGGHADFEGEAFPCTGHAHLAGEHILCISPAHAAAERTVTAGVCQGATIGAPAAAATFYVDGAIDLSALARELAPHMRRELDKPGRRA